MILVALDTATPSTVAGVLLTDGRVIEARDDPLEGARGDHAARLLALAEQALAEGGVSWDDVERIAVGVGPGGFTGLRIGVATARALAQGNGLPLVPVSSLAALAAGAGAARRRDRRGAGRAARRGLRRGVGGRPASCSSPPRWRRRRSPRGCWSWRCPCRRWETGRYAFGRSSKEPGSPSRSTDQRSTGSPPRRSAGSGRRARRPNGSGCCRTTGASPTPSRRSDDRTARRRHRRPPPHLRRPPAGRRGRAPRVPDALVAGDVRAGALQAVRHLPGRVRRGRADGLPRVLALRHGLAHHERGGRPRPAPPRHRLDAADPPVRAGRRPRRAVHARGAPLQRRARRAL